MPMGRDYHRFTVDEYERLIEYGIFTEKDRVELIRGEIFEQPTIGDQHAGCVNRLNRLLSKKVGELAIVAIQNPIILADSEPEPDVALLRPRDDFYDSAKPRSADVLLVIEVADSSLDYDREVKGPLYAEAGITEYWILNLGEECLEVHRQPQADGTYRDIQILRRGQQAEVAALSGVTIAVEEMLSRS